MHNKISAIFGIRFVYFIPELVRNRKTRGTSNRFGNGNILKQPQSETFIRK